MKLGATLFFAFNILLQPNTGWSTESCEKINQRVVEYLPNINNLNPQNKKQLTKALQNHEPKMIRQGLMESCHGKCELSIPWLLSQGNSSDLRLIAHEYQKKLSLKRLLELEAISGSLSEELTHEKVDSKLLSFYRNFNSKQVVYSKTSKLRMMQFNEIAKKNSPKRKLEETLITFAAPLNFSEKKSFISAIEIAKPFSLRAFDFSPPIFSTDNISIMFSDDWSRLLSDPRYSNWVSTMAAEILENQRPENEDFIGFIYRTIEQQPQFKSAKSKEQAIRTFLRVYASRGASMNEVIPYFESEHAMILTAIGIIATDANLKDAQWFQAKNRFYSIPEWIKSDGCLIAKPYHFWMGAVLSEALQNVGEDGALGSHIAATFYEFYGSTSIRGKSLLASKDPKNIHNISIRLNILLDDLGTLLRNGLNSTPHPIYKITSELNKFQGAASPIKSNLRPIDWKNYHDLIKVYPWHKAWETVIAPDTFFDEPRNGLHS